LIFISDRFDGSVDQFYRNARADMPHKRSKNKAEQKAKQNVELLAEQKVKVEDGSQENMIHLVRIIKELRDEVDRLNAENEALRRKLRHQANPPLRRYSDADEEEDAESNDYPNADDQPNDDDDH